ncbi:MAG: TIGR03862 family flavoprotein [Alphaproteobacteria bacterium]|nr:TIGR03862 family flavoprotein [Alphaproteobacteria bacterium]
MVADRIVRVVGAGPSGLMAAEVLAMGGVRVTIIDHMAAPARKFLLAGRGGLNLTHSEPLDLFLEHYGEARSFLEPAIRAFAPSALIDWCHGLGIETFVGSSGRVFPKCMKASPLLRAWLRRLDGLGVTLMSRTAWQGFDGTPTILAMGGASWPHLGSNAVWVPLVEQAGITVNPFKPSNCRFLVPWTEHFSSRFAGEPVKNVRLSYRSHSARGEIMISRDGIEGGAVYALSRYLRDEPGAPLSIDLRPDLTQESVAAKLSSRSRKETFSNFQRKAFNLSPAAIGLMHETGASDPKSLSLSLRGPAGLARAISSAGGIARGEVDGHFQLRKVPGCYAVGEMLDWEAPTGGYLLQACFSTAVMAARDCLAQLA